MTPELGVINGQLHYIAALVNICRTFHADGKHEGVGKVLEALHIEVNKAIDLSCRSDWSDFME